MKWWYWLILELLIIFGVIAWIYFFPSDFDEDFSKGLIGFWLFYAIEKYRDINRRKTVDYKEGMTCGECLKYSFCPVANHNANHKACMKITTTENYTIEQNAGENRIEGGVVGISGSVTKQYRPFNNCNELIEVFRDKCEAEVNCSTFFPKLYKACIWVKHKEYGTEFLITAFDNRKDLGTAILPCVCIQEMWVDFDELLEGYTFLDGSPCGVEE